MARSGVGIFRLLPHSLGEWMLKPGVAVSDEPNFPQYSSLLHALDDGDVLTKCLNSMCYATLVFRPLNLQNLMTPLLRRLVHEVAQVCAGSLALPEDLSGPAVLSPTGTALLQATH